MTDKGALTIALLITIVLFIVEYMTRKTQDYLNRRGFNKMKSNRKLRDEKSFAAAGIFKPKERKPLKVNPLISDKEKEKKENVSTNLKTQ